MMTLDERAREWLRQELRNRGVPQDEQEAVIKASDKALDMLVRFARAELERTANDVATLNFAAVVLKQDRLQQNEVVATIKARAA